MSLSSFFHTVKWFLVLLYKSPNLRSVICLHTVCSIWPIDRTLSGATTPGWSGPGNNGNEVVLLIPQIFKAGVTPTDSLMSYLEHSLVMVLPLCREVVDVFILMSSVHLLNSNCFLALNTTHYNHHFHDSAEQNTLVTTIKTVSKFGDPS